MWSEGPWPTTRKPVVRLSRPHTTLTGAQLAAAKRLYELTLGAKNTASSRASAIWPPRNQRIVSDMPYGSAPSRKNRASSSGPQALMWRWPDEPVHVWSGLAMNVRP